MHLDVHAHYFPRSAVEACERGEEWYGTTFDRAESGVPVAVTAGSRFAFGSPSHFDPIEWRLERMDELELDVQILSLLPPLFRYGLDADLGLAASRTVNDELAEIVRRWPKRFLALATVPLQDVDAAVEELRRARLELGLVGVAVGSHVNGTNWDAPELCAFLEVVEDLEALLLIHPIHPRDSGALGRFYLRNVIGNPWETTVAASCLAASGTLDRFPRLRVCLAHAGGYLAFASGRLDRAFAVRKEMRGGAKQAPSSYLDRFLFDSITHSPLALRFLVDAVGQGNVVLGTDFPADMGKLDAVADIRANDLLTEEEKRAILGENMARLLGVTNT